MHWTQLAYIAALLLALGIGRPGYLVASVMVGNLLATITLAPSPLAIGVADIVCAGILLTGGVKAHIVAYIFAAMVPVYVAAAMLHWQNSTTYAIIDALAYLQLAVIGGVGGGYVNRRWPDSRRGNPAGHFASAGHHSAVYRAPSSGPKTVGRKSV